MKALIFGANGQDGPYLAEACRKRSIEAIGVARSGDWLQGDVGSFDFVSDVVAAHRPDLIFNLAAVSTTRHQSIFQQHYVIGGGTLNILESVYRHVPICKVFVAGSGLQFVNQGKPISERDCFDHSSAYVAARNYATYLSRYYRGLGIHCYIGYLFHHESPRRQPYHLSQKIVQAVKRIAAGSSEMIEVGDLEVAKEYSYAGDVVEGILTLVSQDKVFEATIGSGRAYAVSDWLQACFEYIGKDWRAYTKTVTGYQAEYRILVSDPSTMHSLGWATMMELRELAVMMLNS